MEVLPSYNNTTFVCTWQMGLGIWRKHQFKAAQPFLELCIYKLTRDKIWRAQRDFLLGVTLCNTNAAWSTRLTRSEFFSYTILLCKILFTTQGFCTPYQSLHWNKNWPLQIVSFCYNIVFLSAVTVQSLLSMHDWSNQAYSGEVHRIHIPNVLSALLQVPIITLFLVFFNALIRSLFGSN